MIKHIEIVAYLHIVYGVLTLIGAFFAFIAIAGGGLISGDTGAMAITAGVGFIIGLFLVILALPSLLGGYGLLKRKHWARILVIVLSILNLLSFPFGTALGIYSLWVLLNEEVQAEFVSNKVYQ